MGKGEKGVKMEFKIKHKITGNIIFTHKTKSLGLAVEAAVKSEANLSRAYLSEADLSGANLSEANLSEANLSRAYLYEANLSRAYLYGANLAGANLCGAYLTEANLARTNLCGADLYGANLAGAYLHEANLAGIKMSWTSHDLVAFILRQSAGDNIPRLQVAGLVLIRRDWCWKEFLSADMAEKEWALDELSRWVQDGDDAPAALRDRIQKIQEADDGR